MKTGPGLGATETCAVAAEATEVEARGRARDAATVTIIAPMPAPASLLFRHMRSLAFVVDRWSAGWLVRGVGEHRASSWQSFPLPVSDRMRWSLREQRNS